MKLALDLPSVAIGIIFGLVLAATPFGAHLLFSYEGHSFPLVAACALFLVGFGGVLLAMADWPAFIPIRVNSFTPTQRPLSTLRIIRVNSFTPIRRPLSAASVDADKRFIRADPALKPMEWLSGNGCAHAAWKEACFKAFRRQVVGDENSCLDSMVHAVAVVLSVDVYLAGKRREEMLRLSDMVVSTLRNGGVPDFAGFADRVVAEYGVVLSNSHRSDRHAYPSTRLLAVIDRARNSTRIVPSSMFLWLKLLDRSLYYAVSSLGRRTYFIEGAGIMSHYLSEKSWHAPVVEPNVVLAVDRLGAYLGKHYLLTELNGKTA